MSHKDEQIVKVEGWVSHNYEGNGACAFCVRSYEGDRPALLLIAPEGSTQVPRVLTLEEHEAKMSAMLDDMRRMFRPGKEAGKPTIDRMFVDEFVAILRAHSITL